MQHFSEFETQLQWAGPVGEIEMITTEGNQEQRRPATAIICHPHPLFGGTMGNKVVTTLARMFHDKGFATIRFNFRGVGKSEGAHDQGHGETDDVLAIARWVKQLKPDHNLWFAGFSFGGFVAANAASKLPLDVTQLLSVAPQVSRFQTANLQSIECPWLVVQGEKDEIVSPEEVYAWVDKQQPKPDLIRIPEAGHFFHRQLGDLRLAIETHLFR